VQRTLGHDGYLPVSGFDHGNLQRLKGKARVRLQSGLMFGMLNHPHLVHGKVVLPE